MIAQERKRATAFAPATIANLGPGFDLLGVALVSPGDTVSITLVPGGEGISVVYIEGDDGRLPHDPKENTAAVAVAEVLKRSGKKHAFSVEISIQKGLPLGSGLGSSGASAVAGAIAMNALLEEALDDVALLEACRCAEAVACGAPHGDNVAPALLGGIVLLPSKPGVLPVSLPVPADLFCALAHPEIEVRTQQAREVLPKEVPLSEVVFNGGQLASLVSALYEGNLQRLGDALEDRIVTPARSGLIPGFSEVNKAALDAGALGVGISGSGPTLFALVQGEGEARAVATAMGEAFKSTGISATSFSSPISTTGAHLL